MFERSENPEGSRWNPPNKKGGPLGPPFCIGSPLDPGICREYRDFKLGCKEIRPATPPPIILQGKENGGDAPGDSEDFPPARPARAADETTADDARVAREGRSAEFRAAWHEEHGTAAKPRR
mgnify:CR=1 FL=1